MSLGADQAQAFTASWLPQPYVDVIGVQLHPLPSGAGEASILVDLCKEEAFHFHSRPDSDSSPAESSASSTSSQSDVDSNTNTSSRRAVLTASKASAHACARLRALGFGLHCSGVSRQGLSSASAPPPPCAALDGRPVFSFQHDSMLSIFRSRSRQVESLLLALKRAQEPLDERSEQSEQSQQSSHEAFRQQVRQLGKSRGISALKVLKKAFGPNFTAHLKFKSGVSFGHAGALIGDAETNFNFALNRSTVQAVNAVLLLIHLSEDDEAATASEGAAAFGDANSTAQQDPAGDDQAAAELLVRACRRFLNDKRLKLVTAEDTTKFDARYRDALTHAKADWVLVTGRRGSYEVLGVVESKPRAESQALVGLTRRRLNPLNATPKLEADVLRPAAATKSKFHRPRRSLARVDYGEGKGPSRGQERQQDALWDPHAPPKYGYADHEAYQKLLVQLSSQMVLCNTRHAILWAGWGHLLLPVRLASVPGSDDASDAQSRLSRCALAFAPLALDTKLDALSQATSPSPLGGTSSGDESARAQDVGGELGFHRLPNVIMALVQWALFVRDDMATSGRLLPDKLLAAALSLNLVEDAEDAEDAEPSPPRGKGKGKKRDSGAHKSRGAGKRQRRAGQGTQRRQALDENDDRKGEDEDSLPASSSMESLGEGDHGRRRPLGAGPTSSPPSSPIQEPSAQLNKGDAVPSPAHIVRRMVEPFSFARGAFAEVHRGVISRPGQPDTACVYKINRTSHRIKGDIDRWDEPDEEGVEAVMERFEAEREALQALEPLQGSIVPRLLGISQARRITVPGDSPALILEYVGQPIWSNQQWPPAMSLDERRRLVREAYAALHEAGWLHGDIAARNVLISTKPKQDGSGGQDVRICLIDFARAEPRPSEPSSDKYRLNVERREIEMMLDETFPPSAPF